MEKPLSAKQRGLAHTYLAYRVLTNMWFFSAVWLSFYRLFVTDQQVGIFDAFAFSIGLIAEVPSGALADKFGRDRIVKLGNLLIAVGITVQVTGKSFTAFMVGQSILLIGASFVSGAYEALFFDKLNFNRNSSNWRKLVTRGSQVALAATLTATMVGGWLHTINPAIPWFFTAVCFVGSVALIWPITETRTHKTSASFIDSLREYVANIQKGFNAFRLPKLSLYIPLILTVQGLFYTTGWGILRLILLDRFHFSPFWGSVTITTSGLITIGILHLVHKYADTISEKTILTIISLSAAASLLLAVADIGMWGYIVILTLYAGEHILHPFMSEIVNNNAESAYRATALSVTTFFQILPYVVLAPTIGYVSTHQKLEYFLVPWSLLICLAVLLYLAVKRSNTKIHIPT